VPAELQKRLVKLSSAQEIMDEMNIFHNEEVGLRNLDARQTSRFAGQEAFLPPFWHPQEHFQFSQFGFRPESIPWRFRDMEIPPELQKRIILRTQNMSDGRETAILDEIRQFEGDQRERRLTLEAIQKRRRTLDRELLTRPPSQIEIVTSVPNPTASSAPAEKRPPVGFLQLTPEPQSVISTSTVRKGKP
jgi:hypothetical protein